MKVYVTSETTTKLHYELEKGQGEALVPLSKVSHGRLEVEFPRNG